MFRGFLALCCIMSCAVAWGQTPEQQRLWDAQEAQARAAEKAHAEQLAQDRALRRADPMAWVRTLDALHTGGWEFHNVASDGSWAIFFTDHQLQRSGQVMTAWLRQEFAEPQQTADGVNYLSEVQRIDLDCAKNRTRASVVIFYAGNNLKGNAQDAGIIPKEAPWSAIVPGTQNESNLQWACAPERMRSAH
jgi:hypothetical protein